MDSTIISLIGVVIAAAAALIGAMFRQGTWLTKQFDGVKDFVNVKIDGVMDKLEYHERHDDTRFNNMNEALWTIRLENAQNQRIQRQVTTYSKNPRPDVRSLISPPDEGLS